MKTSDIIGAVALALALSTAAPLALANSPTNSQQLSAPTSPLILVRGGGIAAGWMGGMGTRSQVREQRLGRRFMPPPVIAPPLKEVPKVAPLAPRIGQ